MLRLFLWGKVWAAVAGREVGAIEYAAGSKNLQRLREEDANHPVEKVGDDLRKMMSWIK